MTNTKQPLGIRNRNPLNIEAGDPWQGLDDPPTDGRFARFKSVSYGIRAGARILIKYQDVYGIRTVQDAIYRWAPPTENDSDGYARYVANRMGVDLADRVNFHDYHVLRPMVAAMIEMEVGRDHGITGAEIDRGLALAGVEPDVEPISKSRTVRGGKVAGGAGVIAVATGLLEVVSPVMPVLREASEMVATYRGAVFLALGVLTLIGVGITLWARWDDWRRLRR